MPPFSFTSTGVDGQGSTFVTVIQVTPTEPWETGSRIPESTVTPILPTSVTALDPNSHSSESGTLFSWTSVFTDSEGKLTTTVIQATFIKTMTSVQQPPLSSLQSGPFEVFTSTSMFTDGDDMPVTTTFASSKASAPTPVPQTTHLDTDPLTSESAQPTLDASQSGAPAPSFSFTSVFTDDSGQLTTTVIEITPTQNAQPPTVISVPSETTTKSRPAPTEPFSFTSIFTDTSGVLTTTVIEVQPTSSSPELSQLPNPTATPSVQSFTFTTTFTNDIGQTVTSLIPGVFTPSLSTPVNPDQTSSGGFPSITSAPATTLVAHPCEPYPGCLLTATDASGKIRPYIEFATASNYY